MTPRASQHSTLGRRVLLVGASLAALATALPAPVSAQTMGAVLGRQPAPRPATTQVNVPVRSGTMKGALQRQQTTQARVDEIRAYVASIREAANRGPVVDGLDRDGLDPTDAIREAIAATRAGNTTRANELLISAGAQYDLTGLKTWQGAGLPSQTPGTDGHVTVTIDQTQERALLSWNRFDIGKNTTLQFNQKSNGQAQPGWVAVNRVTNATDPSLILGNLKADGAVVVLNRAGIIFGKDSQVNTHSLLASTLELGNAARFVDRFGGPTTATTLVERNAAYLELGLFTPANGTAGLSVDNTSAVAPLLVSGMTTGDGKEFASVAEGGIVVDAGARINGGAGGFVMLTAPEIANGGALSAVDGQVSLQAGRAVMYGESTGADSSLDPYVRGYKLNSFAFTGQADGTIVNNGLIESKRGYLSLGTGAEGSIAQNGLLSATTSVARNGKISLTAGQIVLGGSANARAAGALVITADDNGETIPIGTANEPAGFKPSQIEIGTQFLLLYQRLGGLAATDLTLGQNALIYAPGATVSVGVNTIEDEAYRNSFNLTHPGRIEIGRDALVDVSGLKDVQLDASRNSIEIAPVKRGELRDTPNYREVEVDGNFSLNGKTMFIDPRLSGVREDGVAWVGSPLIEGASIAGQIPATAAEFMTKGGTVTLATSELQQFDGVTVANAPSVHIANGATIDISGGWVSYAAGSIKTSKLVTADGRIVDIAKASPNDVYVDVITSTTEVRQPRIGMLRSWQLGTGQRERTDAAYDEGRDAGALTISGAAVTVDGTVHANAFAGARQIAKGDKASLVSTTLGRSLQASPYELPSGGALSISSLGDMLVYHGTRGNADSNRAELLLSDTMLNYAGLSQLSLTAAGMVTFAGLNPVTLQGAEALQITGVSDLNLMPGGLLSVEAGRRIRFDGNVTVASGTIEATTTLFGLQLDRDRFGLRENVSNGSAFRTGLYGEGLGDDLPPNFLYADDPGVFSPFDVIVTGKLSTAGLWVNDYTSDAPLGGAWRNGGSIKLTVAPNVFFGIGDSLSTVTRAVDLSGSVRVSGTLDVSSGGHVTPTGGVVLDGKGGDVSLINNTVYTSTQYTNNVLNMGGTSNIPLGGTSQSVEFTPVPGDRNILAQTLPQLVPDSRSTIDIADASILGFGFAGGGTFELVAPDVSFGSDSRPGSTHIGLDFFKKTGFGTLDMSSYRSRIVDDLFANDRVSKSAFLETTRFVVGNGETLDLTQWMLPTLLTVDQSNALRSLGTGANLRSQSFLAPTTNVALWDRKAAHLVLGGLTELDVMEGGSIIGAPEASISVSKLYNAGNITLHGGSIIQRNDLPDSLIAAGLGVRDLSEAFGGSVDGQGRFLDAAASATDPSITNAELVSKPGADRLIHFLALVDQGDGIVLKEGSTTDLSGIATTNPRSQVIGGRQLLSGRVIDGGDLRLDAPRQGRREGGGPAQSSGRALVREDGALLNISGASATFDMAAGLGRLAPWFEWSKAGTISALGGGTLGSTPILAFGGVAQAEGGTLEWLDPTLGSGDGTTADYLNVQLLTDSGFDTVTARRSLTLDGKFDLTLRKALMVTSQDPLVPSNLFDGADVSIHAPEGTDATIRAGYVRLASRAGNADPIAGNEGSAQVRLVGGAQGIDIVGGITIDGSVASMTLATPGDVRLTGVDWGQAPGTAETYDGALVTGGDLLIDARRTYATTGTGNLQGLLEDKLIDLPGRQPSRPFEIAALGDHRITFGNSFLDPTARAPLSAGTHLRVLAREIVQNGYLAAPLGLIELGSSTSIAFGTAGALTSTPTQSLIFGAGSVTSVSGAGLTVPYGTTTDGVEYYFPSISTPLTKLPVGELVLSAGSIVQAEGALIDGRGGGDVYAYEFQSGVGGSRDVLDRFNHDAFSANHYDPATGVGYQYPDQRQVYALVPVAEAGKIAPYDPIYSADYGDLYGAQVGRSVHLDGGNGIAVGEYLLVPAKYAMAIPGALRLVENTGSAAPLPGSSTKLLDGSVVVGGTFAYAGTDIAESSRHSFTVQTKDVFTKYSSIKTTSGSDYLTDRSDTRPRLPLDAARVVLAPLNELKVAGAFDLSPGEGGQAGQIDILGSNILIAAADTETPEGTLLITDATLAKLDAPSLLIGGRRSDNADGTTSITATATNITMAGGASLQASELLLAVGGAGSALTIEDGATLAAIGDPGILTNADYSASGAGSILRIANGPERLIARDGLGASTLQIGAATLSGEALALDTSGSFVVADTATLDAKYAAISGADIRFAGSDDVAGEAGAIGTGLGAKLGAAERLTVRSPGSIRFAEGTHRFNDLVLDTAGLAADAQAAAGSAVRIEAGNVRLANSANAADGCASSALCGSAGSLALDATTISLGSNGARASGFADSVTLAASDGIYVEGKGSFDAGDAGLMLNAPFIADRAAAADPREQTARPDYTFRTSGAVTVSATNTNAGAEITGNSAPGARIAFGTIDDRVQSVSISGATIRATAGIIDVQSEGDISLAGATLSVPGYEKTFGDEVDPVIVSAGGGTINLFSANGSIATDVASALITDTGKGNAGSLNLLAGNGAVALLAALNPGFAIDPEAEVAEGAPAPLLRQGSFTLDSGSGSFDFGGFVENYATQFGGDVWIRTGSGNLDLGQGQNLKAKSVTLTADGGAITIAGALDTSGVDVKGMSADAARNAAVNGGDIALWGQQGVTLASTALLDTHTTGYAHTDSRPAKAGNVTIGVGSESAALTIAGGATIDVGARRTQAEAGVGRLIPQVITDPATGSPVTVYRYAEPDQGGTVTFRAPVIGAQRDKVALSQRGTIVGADSVQLEAFQRYDLDAMADSGLYIGITRGPDGAILLDFGATGANPFTTDMALADGTSSLVRFIQGFDVSTVDGSNLDGMRLRPGVELSSIGAIETVSQWNLAAASFSPAQLQAAVDAGVLELIPEISGGEPRYRVVPGKEGQLLDHHATFLYRTDGSARGEAPVVTLRAGNDLTINRSISDGFFTFRDKSDPDYINYQLGGGDRTYQPGIQFSCGGLSGSCSSIAAYGNGSNPGTTSTLTISLNTAANQGNQYGGAVNVNSPFSLIGNGADGGGEDRNTLGFAELFPLLDGDVAMHSSDLRLVAGAGNTLSANPLVVDRALTADVALQGEYSYRLTATGTVAYDGPLQFRLQRPSTDPTNVSFDIGDTLNLSETVANLNQLRDDAYTQLNWGTSAGLGADTRAAAQAYFAGKGYRFVGNAVNPTGIIAPLHEVVAFLQSFEPTYQAGLASGRTGYSANRTPPVIRYGNANQQDAPSAPNQAWVRTAVRTGDGNIAVAASRDIDLRGGGQPVYRREDGTVAALPNYSGGISAVQFASSAIYTAGVRISGKDVMARAVDTGTLVSISPDSPYLSLSPESAEFIPSPKGISGNQPVLAGGGGDVSLDAGRDVLGRRDEWTQLFGTSSQSFGGARIGNSTPAAFSAGLNQTQPWRTGTVGDDTELGIAHGYFRSGVGALAGGDVRIHAGRDVSQLTVALGTTATTTLADIGKTMLTFGHGDLSLVAGRDVLAGAVDIGSGAATIHARRDISALGREPTSAQTPQYLRLRLADAVVDVSAGGAATLASVSALGADEQQSSAGFFSPAAGFSLSAIETVRIAQTAGLGRYGQVPSFIRPDNQALSDYFQILPPTLELTSIAAKVELPQNSPQLLYPSALGQLRIYSAGDIDGLVIGMDDADPGRVGGAFSNGTQLFQLPVVTAVTTNTQLRLQHHQFITHAGDPEPVRIYTDGSINQGAMFLPKQARITAAGDIVDMFFQGQNVASADTTRIRAGGDITATMGEAGVSGIPYVRSNNFIVGGPGGFIVEAGGDLGPFATSSNVRSPVDRNLYSNAGGIRTIGNDYNPWLPDDGASLSVRFGIAGGADYAALRETYLNPANFAMLDGDLFEQVSDSFGNRRPDRTKPIYTPLLAEWLRDNEPSAFSAIFGAESFPDSEAGNVGLASASYGKADELYVAFAAIDTFRQQRFLIDTLYFNELAQAAMPESPSHLQYVRGYRAVNTLFSPERGYTDNLAPYTTDPSTISDDRPLGVPVRALVDGQPQKAERIVTGNADLRLATIQTARGGDISILAPGGDLIAGSVVRTSEQAARRGTAFQYPRLEFGPHGILEGGNLAAPGALFESIPLGYEGLLTLRGGRISGFTDGDFILNQSRVFSQQSGDITLWSSNGDVAAGQGPKSASNFPPVTVRLDENGLAEVNSAGSVAGAGIGSFQRTPDDPPSDIYLIAPVGLVDAGDAGVRATGRIAVAAAQVANADNFQAAGDITGVPNATAQVTVTTPQEATSAIAAQAAQAANAGNQRDQRSLITVDVLGPASDGRCDPNTPGDPDCR
ncbi:filamentous hemagglutinin family protein [Sphingobium sp. AS12]|uniref:filamentous haemagglutinin family protein n=1 Tax=Sphingobium sp. AS12 TaxID=2849495 RepID=UPI001C3131E1|nr:filamentous haemagglutinin family protein [Sphingobium sp. AS12]MBV2150045.1 filamentous hemagglutinin family protein [Sphingobium sp. AS12]